MTRTAATRTAVTHASRTMTANVTATATGVKAMTTVSPTRTGGAS
ncbi:hypothetical protein [Streptomyces sp. NPDC058371]